MGCNGTFHFVILLCSSWSNEFKVDFAIRSFDLFMESYIATRAVAVDALDIQGCLFFDKILLYHLLQ
jgi:hypothetical protein